MGIVAVLAALLFPTIRGSFDRAAAANCVQNVMNRQRGNVAFSNENHGEFLPAWTNSSTGGISKQWQNQNIFRTYLGIPVGQWGVLNWPPESICAKAEIAQRSLRKTPPDGAGEMARCYGYCIEGNDLNWGVPGGGNPLRSVRVVSPATTIAFADALDWIITAPGSSAYTGNEVRTESKRTAYRHNGAAYVVFFDGRAKRLPPAEIDVNMNPENIKKWRITE